MLAALFAAAIFAVFSSCGDPTDNGGTEPSVPSVSSYTVTFNANGGSAVANQTVTEGAKITEPTPAPAQAGKTFAGWYTDTAFNTKWNFAVDTVSAATTLYAKWVEGENVPSYTVTFNANGGSAVDPQTIVQGEPAQKPPNPTKAGHIFDAWYKEAGFTTEWNFAVDTVTSNTALYAKWTEAFTVTFDSNGGSAVPTLTRAAGEYVYLDGYRSATAKSGYIFDGWYTDQALTQPTGYSIQITGDITLYAKWLSASDLAPYAGVWQYSDDNRTHVLILKEDGTGFSIETGLSINSSRFFSWWSIEWSLSQIRSNYSATPVFEGDQLTYDWNTYIRNRTDTKTPAAAGGLEGVWGGLGSNTIEFKAGAAVDAADNYNEVSMTLNYCVEGGELFLLYPPENLVILSVPISGGKPQGLSKVTDNPSLAGVWKITEDEQDYYYTLDAEGKGTFTTLGASVPVSLLVTEEYIDGSLYAIEGNTLTVDGGVEDTVYTKVPSVPLASGAGGDSRLYGTWKAQESEYTITFKNDGTSEQKEGDSVRYNIWKAEDGKLTNYNLDIFYGEFASSVSYSISGSTLTLTHDLFSSVYTKQ